MAGFGGRWPRAVALTGHLASIAACGSSGAANGGDAGPDAGASASAGQQGPDGSLSSTGDDASSSMVAEPDGASLPAAGQGTLEGNLAFPVGAVVMGFVTGGCSDLTGDAGAGVVPAVQIALVQAGAASDSICGGSAGSPDGGPDDAVYIGIATAQWAAYSRGTLTESLTPGTFTVGSEHLDDEDLCMLAPGSSAYLLFAPVRGESLAIAVSGTVTLDTVAGGAVSGRFDVVMGGPFGEVDAGTSRLSGTFDAVACP
jgi:hypothetical protein